MNCALIRHCLANCVNKLCSCKKFRNFWHYSFLVKLCSSTSALIAEKNFLMQIPEKDSLLNFTNCFSSNTFLKRLNAFAFNGF